MRSSEAGALAPRDAAYQAVAAAEGPGHAGGALRSPKKPFHGQEIKVPSVKDTYTELKIDWMSDSIFTAMRSCSRR